MIVAISKVGITYNTTPKHLRMAADTDCWVKITKETAIHKKDFRKVF